MNNFVITDQRTGHTSSTHGTVTQFDGERTSTLNLEGTTDPESITATGSDLCILTGDGNTMVNAVNTTGNVFIQTGTGSDSIWTSPTATTTIAATVGPTGIDDLVSNFHIGDYFMVYGACSMSAPCKDWMGAGLTATPSTTGKGAIAIDFLGVAPSQLSAMPVNRMGTETMIYMHA